MSADMTGTAAVARFASHGPNASLGACAGEVRNEQRAIDHLALTLQVRAVRGPFEGERAFALRLAHLNGLARPTWVMSRAGLKAFGTVRLCSQCLSLEGWLWRASWEEPNALWCDIHQVWLVDSCDVCGRTFRWSHVGWQACGCGRLLRSLPSARVTATAWELMRSGGASAGVLLWLGAMSKFGPSAKPLKKAQRRGVAELAELLVRGAEVAAGWPLTFDELLDRQIELLGEMSRDHVLGLVSPFVPLHRTLPGSWPDSPHLGRQRVIRYENLVKGHSPQSAPSPYPHPVREPAPPARSAA